MWELDEEFVVSLLYQDMLVEQSVVACWAAVRVEDLFCPDPAKLVAAEPLDRNLYDYVSK